MSHPMTTARPHELERAITRFGALAGAVAGTVGFVYLVGGAVMWLRFWRSDLPADQALALLSKSDLLVVGLRVMILPALAAGALFLVLAKRRVGDRRRMGPVRLALLAVPVLVLALVVPFSPGAYAWPVAALGLWYLWCRVADGLPRRRLVWGAAAAAMLASALVSIARQLDYPVKLPSATLTLAAGESVTGVLVTAGSADVVVGLPEQRRLRSYPRASVETIEIGPALDRRSPSRSLLSMALGGDAWAATPFELWCGGESYGWTSLEELCRTQPRVAGVAGRFSGGAAMVRVTCPGRASRGCSGYLTLTTSQAFAVDGLPRAAPVELGRTVFQVEHGHMLEVALPVSRPVRRCLGATEQPVRLRAVLSTDRAGMGALNGEHGQPVTILFPGSAGGGPCVAAGDAVPAPLPASPPAPDETVMLPAD
jgi:hypothetical protein